MQGINTEIAQLSKQHGRGCNGNSVLFVEMKVMITATAKRGAHDLACLLIDNYLCFYVMMLMLAGIPLLLLFLGRSTVDSVTSTTSA